MMRHLIFSLTKCCARLCLFLLTLSGAAFAQTGIPLNDLSFFRDPGSSWKIASDVNADLQKNNSLQITNGTGVLVNVPDKKNPGKDLFSAQEYGDLDLELDYMMAKGSNSGIYLQGRYEVQLYDSWGVKNPTSADNGGLYERWDETKPQGQKGYEGYAPRQNGSRAPGLWQHLKISFQAPRFDASGKKTENAKMLRVELNGVLIHENIELFGPTRGAMGTEATQGPLRIQGDHGPVALRNIIITPFDKPRPEIMDVKYKLYEGKFNELPDFSTFKPAIEGSLNLITSEVVSINNDYCIQYSGKFHIKESGEYTVKLNTMGGSGQLKIGQRIVIPLTERQGKGIITLPAGDTPFEIVYTKFVNGARSGIMLTLSAPGMREYLVSDKNSHVSNTVDPILVNVYENSLLRSFIDLPDKYRVVHAISVGSPEKVHYTYDMDNGTIVQVWRGEFLDATPMWHERGDGSSRAVGMVQRFGKPVPTLAKLASSQSEWLPDTTASGFRTKGYRLNKDGEPTFRYAIFDALVNDEIRVLKEGYGISRSLTIEENAFGNFYARLAEGKSIERLSETLYSIDDKSYYLRLEDVGKAKPIIREVKGRKELIVPVQNKIMYSILF